MNNTCRLLPRDNLVQCYGLSCYMQHVSGCFLLQQDGQAQGHAVDGT